MDTKALTYAELGEALGITAASAKRLSNRRKWAKIQGNDGLARVLVPVERLNAPRPTPENISDDSPEDAPSDTPRDSSEDVPRDTSGDARALIAVLESRIGDLQGRISEMGSELKESRSTLAAALEKAAKVEPLEILLDAEKRHLEEERLRFGDLLEAERQRVEEAREAGERRVEEWKAVADRFAAQTEQMLTAQAQRGWWPWRRRA